MLNTLEASGYHAEPCRDFGTFPFIMSDLFFRVEEKNNHHFRVFVSLETQLISYIVDTKHSKAK